MNEASLCWWYPIIETYKIPSPKTFIIPIEIDKLLPFIYLNKNLPKQIQHRIEEHIKELSWPVFIRTDLTSYKTNWKNSCFVEKEKFLIENLRNILKYSCLIPFDLKTKAIIVREFIKFRSGFNAFKGQLPISVEFRVFIRNGIVLKIIPYWSHNDIFKPDNNNWRNILQVQNCITDPELQSLSLLAARVSEIFKSNFLSVDFALTKNNGWFLIDIAPGEHSSKREFIDTP